MLKSLCNHLRCPITVIIDPAAVQANETEALKQSFGPAGYAVREALGPQAISRRLALRSRAKTFAL